MTRKRKPVRPPKPAKSKELMMVEQAISTGTAIPVKFEVDNTRPIAQGSFSAEVLPVGLAFGTAGAAIFGGAVALLLYLNQFISILGRARPGLLAEAWPAALFAGMVAFGIGLIAGVLLSLDDFVDRLWHGEQYAGEFEPSPLTAAPPPDTAGDAHYVQLSESGGMERLPNEPRKGALAEFAQAVLLNSSSLSEAGAADFGYGRKRWEALRDYLLKQGVILWADPEHHQQGLELSTAGRRVFVSLAANLMSPLPAAVDAQ